MRTVCLLLALVAIGLNADKKNEDRVASLPGVTFNVRFNHYAGYLDASLGNHLHYWLFESQMNMAQAPLILWLGGRAGCSSLAGALQGNGPFRPTQDGQHLQENVFSWNKVANLLYIDSPRDVGYSYRDGTQRPDNVYNNSKTTDDLIYALQSFITAFPEYRLRDLYIAGESYGGVYVPQLTDALIKRQNVDLTLKGFAVGNGLLNIFDSFNSIITMEYFRGMIGKHDYDSFFDCCSAANLTTNPLMYCDFSSFLDFSDGGVGDIKAKKFTDPTLQSCADKVFSVGMSVFKDTNNYYNTYQDCYTDGVSAAKTKTSNAEKSFNNYEGPFYDQGNNQFAGSTDSEGGLQCYMDAATEKYMNIPEVRNALHVVETVGDWKLCKDLKYVQNEYDMSNVFDSIIDSGSKIRALIYNGDVDMADSFMTGEWFVERIVQRRNIAVIAERAQWNYTRQSNLAPVGGGYVKQFKTGSFSLDQVTVKGAGHLVSTDRPGPSLQMITNFIGANDYNQVNDISLKAADTLPEFKAEPELILSRKEADRIFDLPGLTFELNFHQYAGYLNAAKGNYLHYWLLESQASPEHDPLIIWLSGGPGCSGYTALLWGNGPFRPNRDGQTLSENVYSWNKVANVVFLDSPRGVGYSFQNTTENPSTEWSDELTADDLYLAVVDFFEAYPEYKNRPFYLTGESYGGVYVPSTAALLVDKITDGTLPYIKFEGIAVANSLLSSYDNYNAAIQYQYYHGALGKKDYDALQECCPQSEHYGDGASYFEFCDYTHFITFDVYGNAQPRDDNDICANRTIEIVQHNAWNGPQIQYNLYASCYEFLDFGIDKRPELIKPYYAKKGFEDWARIVSHEVSDSQDGQFCWGQMSAAKYMNTPAVQVALHARQPDQGTVIWKPCSDEVASVYKWQYYDMRPFFDRIIEKNIPFKFLIYNGDIDMTCNFLSDQWFLDRMTKSYAMEVSRAYKEWRYLKQIGGYSESFKYKSMTFDFVTVKGSGHFTALDRPGPTLQVISSFINSQPYDKPAPADLELANLEDRYNLEEQVGRQKDLNVATPDAPQIRAKRSAKITSNSDTLPPPPPACSIAGDKITDLPGLTFDFTSDHFSGYLNVDNGNYLHYWLVEADKDPDTAPLILWLNGGPGCSSLSGLLKAMGPYLNNLDGETLYENIFSWHKVGNLLFLESPKDVGFSYQASNSDPNTQGVYNDDLTAEDNVRALIDFLNCHPKYKDRRLFITGESYSGIYVPTFVDLLLKKIADGSVTGVNLEGIAIGNGYFSAIQLLNSGVSLTYFRGFHSKDEYQSLERCVPSNYEGPMGYYDWSNYITFDPRGNPIPKNSNLSTTEGFCGSEVARQGYNDVWYTDNDVYDTYQDCYERNPLPSQGDQDGSSNSEVLKRRKRDAIGRPMKYTAFVDEAKRVNYQSTDNNGGLQCADPKSIYLNRADVKKAIHIPDTFTKTWEVCNDDMDQKYVQEYNDTTIVFKSILASLDSAKKPLRVLFYHGDADMACQFLSGQWFTEALAQETQMTVSKEFNPWDYVQKSNNVMRNIGGYVKSWSYSKQAQVSFDLLTIKGAGHQVQVDRPGPILQAITNFVKNIDYSTPLWQNINIDRKPLLSSYIGAPDRMITRAEADRIYNLPGLTFKPVSEQHSGYLQSSKGNKLFYWFHRSQNTDPSTPLVLWLNGGPGCSSLIGMLQENGPFRVNPDQRTLYENVYSWNKAAHMLYIDSPRQVGYSYQNQTENDDAAWDDDKTASDAYLAIEDFFTIYPDMKKLDFYTSGESYCGVYIPLITAYIVNKIKAKESTINLKAMIIGNGEVSFKQDLRSTPSFFYYRALTGKTEFDSLSDCCTGEGSKGGLYCHYDDFMNPMHWTPRENISAHDAECANRISNIVDLDDSWDATNDGYNLYQDCYALPLDSTPSSMKKRVMMRQRRRGIHSKAAQQQQSSTSDQIQLNNFDPLSTDNNDGFYCYMDDATENYLNQPHVRSAIHVPDYVQPWTDCSDPVHDAYEKLYEDMSASFVTLITSDLPLKVLIYNGDVDTVCQFMQAQWFVEELAHDNGLSESSRDAWHYRGVIAGYSTSFTSDKFQLDLLTVKGAGHYVPLDRPGPTLQMIGSFLRGDSYDTPIPYSLDRQPLLYQYTRKGTELPDNSDTSSATTPDTPTDSTIVPEDTSSIPSSTTTISTTTTQSSSLMTIVQSFIIVLFASFLL